MWLTAHRSFGHGFRCLLSCPSLSSGLWLCRFLWVLFSYMVLNLHDGATPEGSRLVNPRSDRRFGMFLFPFWAISLCCHCPSGSGHRMGQVCWSVPTCAHPSVVSDAPYRCRRVSWWSSLRPKVFGCSWLSPVFFPIR